MYSTSSDTNVTQLTVLFEAEVYIFRGRDVIIDVYKADDKIATSGATNWKLLDDSINWDLDVNILLKHIYRIWKKRVYIIYYPCVTHIIYISYIRVCVCVTSTYKIKVNKSVWRPVISTPFMSTNKTLFLLQAIAKSWDKMIGAVNTSKTGN